MEKSIINTQKAPKAIGPYSQAINVGNFLFISGQLPINPENGELLLNNIQEETKQALNNLKAIVEEAGAKFSDIVKTTIFIKDMNQFSLINEAYAQYFPENPPARSCVEVAKLPKDANIEIEAIVYKD